MKQPARTLEQQLSMDVEQLTQRLKMGDHLDLQHPVEHVALFRYREHAVNAATELATLGYRTRLHRRRLRFEVTVVHESALDDETVREFVTEVFGIVERNHGRYEGWGGPIVRPADGTDRE